jgi:ElaB/YqjD/DUF883 family membrane-anchored ribosome-binding protein
MDSRTNRGKLIDTLEEGYKMEKGQQMEMDTLSQLKELLTTRFDHLEKVIQGNEDRNSEDHKGMKRNIAELYEENKTQNKEIDERFDKQGERMGKTEQALARMDERHKMTAWFIGLGVGVVSGIVGFVMNLIQ